MEELYIIGNGFDRYHGMETSYYHFREYLRENNCTVYKSVMKFLYYKTKKETEEIKENRSEFWSNFEYNLRKLDEENIIDECHTFLTSYGDSNWRDRMHHDYQYCIDEKISCLSSLLLEEFTKWIRSCNCELKDFIPKVKLNKGAKFMTFNYTMTLQEIYDVEPNKVFHVHNSIEGEGELVLGHNYSESERLYEESKTPTIKTMGDVDNILADRVFEDDIRYHEGEEILKSYYNKNYKDSGSIIKKNKSFFAGLSDVDKIYILGHSMSVVDITYMKEILKSVSDKTLWYFTQNSEEDVVNIQNFVNGNDIANYKIGSIRDDIFRIVSTKDNLR